MSKELIEITFDFSKYFEEQVIFKETCDSDELFINIIHNSDNLTENQKISLNNHFPYYFVNGKKIKESLSLKENNIENGSIIIVDKIKKNIVL